MPNYSIPKLCCVGASLATALLFPIDVTRAEIISVANDGFIQASGTNGLETVTDSETIGTHRSGGSNIRHGLFEFDLHALHLPTGAEVQSAALQFELTSAISNTRSEAEVAFYGFSSDGSLTATDYDSPVSTDVNLLASNLFAARGDSPPVGSLLTIPVANLDPIRNAISDGSRYFTVRSETVNFVRFQVGAQENPVAVPASLLVTMDVLRGDFNRDGLVDILDIEEFVPGNSTYELTGDEATDKTDLDLLVSTLVGTWFGDSNGDGQFETGDLVSVFSRGKFETGAQSNWRDGDWNRDGVFDSGDFVTAFRDGGFERGPRMAPAASEVASAVPEPQSVWQLLVFAVYGGISRRRIRNRSV